MKRRTLFYRVEMILGIGYRVKGPRCTQFRQWATANLSEYLRKGFVMNDERLKNPDGWDYFEADEEDIEALEDPEKKLRKRPKEGK